MAWRSAVGDMAMHTQQCEANAAAKVVSFDCDSRRHALLARRDAGGAEAPLPEPANVLLAPEQQLTEALIAPLTAEGSEPGWDGEGAVVDVN
ncbi:hypothetical protein J1614_005605 [Plenodomus biglobosus]|nr:hypothetical protein J1614_005605 [Plenodomus biglobosus]